MGRTCSPSPTLGMGDKEKGKSISKKHKAIPGGGSGKNSVYMAKGPDGSMKAMGEVGEDEGFSGTSIFDPVLCASGLARVGGDLFWAEVVQVESR